MRKPALNCKQLSNGLMIKGSYTLSHSATIVSLYIVNSMGHIFASRNYAFSDREPTQECLVIMLSALYALCCALKLDQITQPRIQEAASKAIMLKLTKKAVLAAVA